MISLSGVQFFPVTPFDADGDVNEDVLAAHVSAGVEKGPGAVFVACGTGEFHTLSTSEHALVVTRAVREVAAVVPVITGTGGPLGSALEMARNAEKIGADGLLLMPPYLVGSSPQGLLEYVRSVARVTDLPLIVYHRAESQFAPETVAQLTDIPTVMGIKDGLGNVEMMTRIMSEVAARIGVQDRSFQYFNGLPTAETSAIPYRAMGVEVYSSAVFGFVPEVSLGFRKALDDGASAVLSRLLTDFFVPFAQLRSTIPGGAISLVKAGVRLTGLDVGTVRPPLLPPPPALIDSLAALIDVGRDCVMQPIPL